MSDVSAGNSVPPASPSPSPSMPGVPLQMGMPMRHPMMPMPMHMQMPMQMQMGPGMVMGMARPGMMPMGMPMAFPPMSSAPSAPAPNAKAPGPSASAPSAAPSAASSLALPFHTPLAHAARSEGEVVEQRLYDTRLAQYLTLAERRAGTQLALAYARDANSAVAAVLLALRDDALIVLEEAAASAHVDDIGLHALLALNHVPHTRLSVQSLMDTALQPRQTLLICGPLPSEPQPRLLSKIHVHIASGGLVLTYNGGAHVLSSLFPSSLSSVRQGLSSSDKRVLSARLGSVSQDDADSALLSAPLALASQRRLVRVAPSQRFTLAEEQTALEALLVEDAPAHPPQPLLLRHRSGAGALYHLVLISADDAMRARSEEQNRAYLSAAEAHMQLSAETKRMWRSAAQCAFEGAFYHAISLLPFIDLVFALIGRHLAQHGVL